MLQKIILGALALLLVVVVQLQIFVSIPSRN